MKMINIRCDETVDISKFLDMRSNSQTCLEKICSISQCINHASFNMMHFQTSLDIIMFLGGVISRALTVLASCFLWEMFVVLNELS